ncbi:MAG: hypothetical protein H6Q62_110, partial [Firmicutes bacterium]|nr:hypothetical protein [Bacillota bacterium]
YINAVLGKLSKSVADVGDELTD